MDILGVSQRGDGTADNAGGRRTATGRPDLVLSSSLGASVIGLVRTIEDEILPRLRIALDTVSGAGPATPMPTADQVSELARLTVGRDDAASQLYVEALIDRGMAPDVVYGLVLTAAARRLGEFWLDDYCDFSDVTVGMIRLQKIQRALSAEFRRSGNTRAATTVSRLARRRALIVPTPGEQHTFGATLVQDYFSRAGWDVSGWLPSCEADLVAMVRHDDYDMVGLTLSVEARLPDLASCVALIRRASRNPSLVIAVGGPALLTDPGRASTIGADVTAAAGPEAVVAVDQALTRRLEETRVRP